MPLLIAGMAGSFLFAIGAPWFVCVGMALIVGVFAAGAE